MATGDKAAAKGLVVVPATEPMNKMAERQNQRGDELADVIDRLLAVESTALAPPMFSVQRSSGGQRVGVDTWSQMTGNAFAAPVLRTGFGAWTQGALTIAKSGVYQVSAHCQVYQARLSTVGVQLVRNSYPGGVQGETRVDTIDMLCKDEWGGPRGAGSVDAATATAFNMVRLVAGDVVRLFILQRNADGTILTVGSVPGDLTWSMVWVNN